MKIIIIIILCIIGIPVGLFLSVSTILGAALIIQFISGGWVRK